MSLLHHIIQHRMVLLKELYRRSRKAWKSHPVNQSRQVSHGSYSHKERLLTLLQVHFVPHLLSCCGKKASNQTRFNVIKHHNTESISSQESWATELPSTRQSICPELCWWRELVTWNYLAKCLGTQTFLVQLEDGWSVCHHIDHIQAQLPSTNPTASEVLDMPDIHIKSEPHGENSATEAAPPALYCSARVSVPPDCYSPSSN